MKQKNQGKKMRSVTAVVLAWALAAMMLFPGSLWDAEGVYAADDDTDAQAVSDDDTGSVYSEDENIKIGEAFGDTVGATDGLEGDFILTYNFYNKSNGTDNWDNFVVEVRNEDYYWFDLRADNYGWLYSPTAGYSTGTESITYGNGASDWDVWESLMQKGQDCTVYVIRQGTTVTIVTQSAGDTFYAYATIDNYDDGCALYVHLTGESCTLESVTYSVEYVSDWDAKADWLEALLALADENDEGGASAGTGVTLDGTTLASTEWWSGVTGVEVSSDSTNATWNYTILTQSSVSDFGIEVYNEDGSKYITTLTNGDGWYFGDDFEANDLVIAGSSISDSLERGKLYYVTVERSGNDFTIYYMDSSGDILLMFFATDTNMDETAYVHFYAEYGTFVVAASVGTGSSIVDSNTQDTEEDSDTEEDEDTDTDDTKEEDSEEVEENLDDDDDDDDDYDIEDMDDEEEDDTETEEEDDYIVVTLEEAVYTSSTWWSGAYGSESGWTGDAVWVYSIKVDETYGEDAFSVQVYDEDGNSITLSSDGTSQYDGISGDTIEVSGDAFAIEEGAEYVVAVNREGNDLWIVFYDTDGNELLSYYAANTDLADTAYSCFYAQIGTYTVLAESSGIETAEMTKAATSDTDAAGSESGSSTGTGNGSSGDGGSSGGSARASVSTPATGDEPIWNILLIAVLGMGVLLGSFMLRRIRR